MINPQELRIGNWVYHKGEPVTVTVIGPNGFQHISEDRKIASGLIDMDPIPLTEEWLERFGFKLFEDVEMHSFFELGTIKIWYKFSDDQKFVLDGYSDAPLEHVHHLQNVCLDLSDKELQLKEFQP